ncbi:low molecular weight phosphatase family protein [Phenylobacterium immobile]|uniref:arsenate-mycothiol transferase ArsC n=1 Tax=Phenylobacterium immobile TaxID=21 RepID=UPI000AD598D7|nr:low molecular weight phosphatase family protein [Phenylobacterium immobile]
MLERPGAVLFACNLNRVRSPMAEGLLRRMFAGQVFTDSAGLKDPAMKSLDPSADPFARAVMAEIGVDLSQHRAKTFEDVRQISFDLVISLTPEAHHQAVELTRAPSVEIEYWPTHDPTLAEGTREARLDAYRQVRDALARRIEARFG